MQLPQIFTRLFCVTAMHLSAFERGGLTVRSRSRHLCAIPASSTFPTFVTFPTLTRSSVMRVLHLLSRFSRFAASSRSFIARSASAATLAGVTLATPLAHAEDHVTLLTSWYAQAEHGGFYQAVATGIYKKYGLDVTIKMGGPQVNGMQLLAGGQADFLLGYDFQVLSGVEAGIPVTTVAAAFQYDPQGMMTHADVSSLGGLKNKTILVAGSGRTTWWPWLKAKYGYTEAQARPYTFNLQPFFADQNVAMQAYPSSETFQAEQAHANAHFFLFADDGYPPYNTTIVTMRDTMKNKPDVVARFVKASMEGWKSYLNDPAPGNALIRKDNPQMSDAQLAYGVAQLKKLKIVTGGDAATQGIGTMSDARWKKTFDYMVDAKLLKAATDYHAAYTLQFIQNVKVMP
jgi:NitT/TauT family transport system substrate-binding protein